MPVASPESHPDFWLVGYKGGLLWPLFRFNNWPGQVIEFRKALCSLSVAYSKGHNSGTAKGSDMQGEVWEGTQLLCPPCYATLLEHPPRVCRARSSQVSLFGSFYNPVCSCPPLPEAEGVGKGCAASSHPPITCCLSGHQLQSRAYLGAPPWVTAVA